MNVITRRVAISRAVAMTAAVGAALALTACATIIHSRSQEVGISSTPAGATVSIDHVDKGTTPLVAKLSRKDLHVLRIEMAGYQPYEATLNRKVSGWVWGNLVFGGLVGLAVDAVSGGMYKLTPEQVSAVLNTDQASIARQGDGLYVFAVLEPKADWARVGQLQRSD